MPATPPTTTTAAPTTIATVASGLVPGLVTALISGVSAGVSDVVFNGDWLSLGKLAVSVSAVVVPAASVVLDLPADLTCDEEPVVVTATGAGAV